jgi:hypothetical protein
MAANLEILFAPLHRRSSFIGGLRCQAVQTEDGPYKAERTQKAVYIVRWLWIDLAFLARKHAFVWRHLRIFSIQYYLGSSPCTSGCGTASIWIG